MSFIKHVHVIIGVSQAKQMCLLSYYYFIHKTSLTPPLFIGLPGQEEFEDIKGVIRIRKSKRNWQQNDQKKKD
jgi:hypothetical protein